jgi:anti-anti-sigma factor
MRISQAGTTCRVQIEADPIFRDFAMARMVAEAVPEGTTLVEIDLSRIEDLHSPGLANLVSIHCSCAKRGIRVRLTGLTDMHRRLLSITRLDSLLSAD